MTFIYTKWFYLGLATSQKNYDLWDCVKFLWEFRGFHVLSKTEVIKDAFVNFRVLPRVIKL